MDAIKTRVHEVEETKRTQIKEHEQTARNADDERGQSNRDGGRQTLIATAVLFVSATLSLVGYYGIDAWRAVQVARAQGPNPAVVAHAPVPAASAPPVASALPALSAAPPAPAGSSITVTISAAK